MGELRVLAAGFKFPEGPAVLPDGSVVLTEIAGGQLSRVTPEGKVTLVAKTGGGAKRRCHRTRWRTLCLQ